MPWVDGLRVDDGLLVLRADPGRAGEIDRELVRGGVEVGELTPIHASLEDVFLGLIRKGGDDVG